MDTCSDAVLVERFHERIPVKRSVRSDTDGVKVASVDAPRIGRRRRLEGKACERTVVPRPQLRPPCDPTVEPGELMNAERRRYVGHVEFESGDCGFVVPE